MSKADLQTGLDAKAEWDNLSFEVRLRFVSALVRKVVLTPVAPSWIKLEVYWEKAIGNFIDVRHVRLPQANRLHWTEEEYDILRQMYAKTDAAAILEMLPDRTWTGIKRHANELGLLRERGGKAKDERLPASVRNAGTRKQVNWSEGENAILRQMYPSAKATEILEQLPHRNWRSVISHAYELGITRKREKMITSISYVNPEDRKYEEENGLIPSVKNGDW